MFQSVMDCQPISIHALHEESDQSADNAKRVMTFQSTLSMRRATPAYARRCATCCYFNPRSP